jgi:hypothetical protein
VAQCFFYCDADRPQKDIRLNSFKIREAKRMAKTTVGGILLVLMLAEMMGGGDASAKIITPLEWIASTPKGQLKSRYADFASIAEEGHRKYMAAGCNGCHGGGGGSSDRIEMSGVCSRKPHPLDSQ